MALSKRILYNINVFQSALPFENVIAFRPGELPEKVLHLYRYLESNCRIVVISDTYLYSVRFRTVGANTLEELGSEFWMYGGTYLKNWYLVDPQGYLNMRQCADRALKFTR